ncbi:MAG: hypothetical protein ABIK89_04355 [Planctomycetota bacterium]
MKALAKLVKTILCGAVLGGVFAASHRAAQAELNSPLSIHPNTGPSARRAVLISYANETPTDRFSNANRQTVVEWLRLAHKGQALKLVDAIESDARRFPETAAREVAALHAAAVGRAKTAPFGLVVFTNADARQGQFRYLRPGEEGPFHFEELALPHLDDPILQASPLTEPHVFARALVAVTRLFAPSDHQFVLVTKSHGTPELALMPQLTFQASPALRDKVLAVFDNEASSRVSGDPLRSLPRGTLDPSQGGTLGPMKSAKGLALLVSKPLSPETEAAIVGEIENDIRAATSSETPVAEPKRLVIGISKNVYLAILEQLGRQRGMCFPLVFVESCHSEFASDSAETVARSTANLGVLWTWHPQGLTT